MSEKLQQQFIHILVKGNKDNTYKFALANFLLKYSKNVDLIDNKKISYTEIAETFLEYYWFQEYKYKIKHDFKTVTKPKIISILRDYCGEEYIHLTYEKYFQDREEQRKRMVNEIARDCLRDVIPRFQPNDSTDIFEHFHTKSKNKYKVPVKGKKYIELPESTIEYFKNNYEILYKILILEWAKHLEKTNDMPRLIAKIESLGYKKRSGLKKFREILFEYGNTCFYCNKNLTSNNTHVDHVIPWSYIFEDNIENLVLSCSDCNLEKSDFLPEKIYIEKLNERNMNMDIANRIDFEELYSNCQRAGFTVSS